MMTQITAFFKKNMSTRKKELIVSVLIWIVGLILTNPNNAFTWPYMIFGLLAGLLGVLAITIFYSIYNPLNAKKRQTDPPILALMLKPKDKKKWQVLLVFLALFVPTVLFNTIFPNIEIFRYFLTALMGFLSILFLELFVGKPWKLENKKK